MNETKKISIADQCMDLGLDMIVAGAFFMLFWIMSCSGSPYPEWYELLFDLRFEDVLLIIGCIVEYLGISFAMAGIFQDIYDRIQV